MVMIGISITEDTAFRDAIQEFSNVYHFHATVGMPTNAEAQALINEVSNNEKAFHASVVNFRRGRLWSAGGSESTNEMIADISLTGTGSVTPNASLDRERAFLFRWRVGNNSRGKPNYLRKWYHTCGPFPGLSTIGAGLLTNQNGFTQPERDAMALNAGNVTNIGSPGEPWRLCAPSDQQETTDPLPTAHKYLEHHQLGDQWRG